MRKQGVNMTLDRDLIEWIKTLARLQRRSASWVVNEMLRAAKRNSERDV